MSILDNIRLNWIVLFMGNITTYLNLLDYQRFLNSHTMNAARDNDDEMYRNNKTY